MNKTNNPKQPYTPEEHQEIGDTDHEACPNLCFNGMVKIHDYERALYDLVKCQYCKGKGKVSKQEAIRIDALL